MDRGFKPRRWSITTKVEENINCDVTIKVKALWPAASRLWFSEHVLPFNVAFYSQFVVGWFFAFDRFARCLFFSTCLLSCETFFLLLLISLRRCLKTKLFPLFQLNQKSLHLNANLRSIATGSWGCGSQQAGDPQFKVVIQWLAASVANVPTLIYYTCAKESLSKLDTVVRVLHGEWLFPIGSSRWNSFADFEILRKFFLLCFSPSFRSQMDSWGAAEAYTLLCERYSQQSDQQLW